MGLAAGLLVLALANVYVRGTPATAQNFASPRAGGAKLRGRRALGSRLHFPISFVGRGDMSRGGLLLRQAATGEELEYVPLDAASTRRGPRPPKLEPLAGRI